MNPFLFSSDNLELLSVTSGIRNAFHTLVPEGQAGKYAAFCKSNGLCVSFTSRELFLSKRLKSMRPDGFALAYVSSEANVCKELQEADLEGCEKEVGRLLGYPDCCVKAFIEHSMERKFDLFNHSIEKSKSFSPWLNVFSSSKFVFHFPCSFDCESSVDFAKKLRASWAETHGFQERSLSLLSMRLPILGWSFDNYSVLLGGTQESGRRVWWVDCQSSYSTDFATGTFIERLLGLANCLEVSDEEFVFFNDESRLGSLKRSPRLKGAILPFDKARL